MFFALKNVAGINQASLYVNTAAIVVGENDLGKRHIGCMLWCAIDALNAFCRSNEQVHAQLKKLLLTFDSELSQDSKIASQLCLNTSERSRLIEILVNDLVQTCKSSWYHLAKFDATAGSSDSSSSGSSSGSSADFSAGSAAFSVGSNLQAAVEQCLIKKEFGHLGYIFLEPHSLASYALHITSLLKSILDPSHRGLIFEHKLKEVLNRQISSFYNASSGQIELVLNLLHLVVEVAAHHVNSFYLGSFEHRESCDTRDANADGRLEDSNASNSQVHIRLQADFQTPRELTVYYVDSPKLLDCLGHVDRQHHLMAHQLELLEHLHHLFGKPNHLGDESVFDLGQEVTAELIVRLEGREVNGEFNLDLAGEEDGASETMLQQRMALVRQLQQIFAAFPPECSGVLRFSALKGFYLQHSMFYEPVDVRNLSSSIKSLILLKLLVLGGLLHSSSFLMLDETELKLDQQGQSLVAKLLVWLQSALGVKLLVFSSQGQFLQYCQSLNQASSVTGQATADFKPDSETNHFVPQLAEPAAKLSESTGLAEEVKDQSPSLHQDESSSKPCVDSYEGHLRSKKSSCSVVFDDVVKTMEPFKIRHKKGQAWNYYEATHTAQGIILQDITDRLTTGH